MQRFYFWCAADSAHVTFVLSFTDAFLLYLQAPCIAFVGVVTGSSVKKHWF